MGEHHVPLQIDENNNVTKVGIQLELFPNDIYENCILCGVETTTLKTTHIDFRTGYIEGAGQLCKPCYDTGINRSHIAIPENIICKTPNDQELGGKVRDIYWQHKQQ